MYLAFSKGFCREPPEQGYFLGTIRRYCVGITQPSWTGVKGRGRVKRKETSNKGVSDNEILPQTSKDDIKGSYVSRAQRGCNEGTLPAKTFA